MIRSAAAEAAWIRLTSRLIPRTGLYSCVRKVMKTSSPPSVRWPCESSQVPSPITSSAPLSSIRSISGV